MPQKQGKIKTVEHRGAAHNSYHDPRIEDVKKILRHLKVCSSTGREEFTDKGKKIIYKVFKNELSCTWVIIGLQNRKNVRGNLPFFDGFKMIMSYRGYIKSLFYFQRKSFEFLKFTALKHGDSQVRPQEFPVFEVTDVTLRRSKR